MASAANTPTLCSKEWSRAVTKLSRSRLSRSRLSRRGGTRGPYGVVACAAISTLAASWLLAGCAPTTAQPSNNETVSSTRADAESSEPPSHWDDDHFIADPSDGPSDTGATEFPTRTAQTINPDTGEIQENSLMKWEEWPDNAHLKAALFKAEPSTDMRKAYGKAAEVAAYDAALAVAVAQVGLTDLYQPRTGSEGQYYEPIRPYVTKELWKALQTHIQQGESGQSFYIGSFAPKTDRDGIWTTLDGVPYVSLGWSSVTFTGIPRFSMQDGQLGVAFEIQVTGHARPHDIEYNALYTAIMKLEDDQWKLNGWNNLVTSEIRVVEDPAAIGN